MNVANPLIHLAIGYINRCTFALFTSCYLQASSSAPPPSLSLWLLHLHLPYFPLIHFLCNWELPFILLILFFKSLTMRFSTSKIALVAAALLANSSVQAIVLNTSDSSEYLWYHSFVNMLNWLTTAVSIRNAASTIAYDMMKYYTGNLTGNSANLGLLPSVGPFLSLPTSSQLIRIKPYYWWESGAMFGESWLFLCL